VHFLKGPRILDIGLMPYLFRYADLPVQKNNIPAALLRLCCHKMHVTHELNLGLLFFMKYSSVFRGFFVI
ncbi:MAG: hypothetical protein WCL43_06735, partial [Chlorobium sp.]